MYVTIFKPFNIVSNTKSKAIVKKKPNDKPDPRSTFVYCLYNCYKHFDKLIVLAVIQP